MDYQGLYESTAKAELDDVARRMAAHQDYWTAVYHCQQAAEKMAKAVLSKIGIVEVKEHVVSGLFSAIAYLASGARSQAMNIFTRLFNRDATSTAIARAEKFVCENPQSANAWIALGDALGNAYEDTKKFRSAAPCYLKALEFASRPNTVLRAGHQFAILEGSLKAIEIFKGLIQEFPNRSSYWGALAMAYYVANRWEDAISEATRANELAPDMDMSLLIGRSYFNNKDYERALPALQRGTQLHPTNTCNWYRLSECLEKLGQPNDARVALQRAKELNPNASEIQLKISSMYLDEGGKDAGETVDHTARISRHQLWAILDEMKRDLEERNRLQVRTDAPTGYNPNPQEWLHSFVQFYFQNHEVDAVTDSFMLGLPLYNETFVNEVETLAKGGGIQGSVLFEMVAAAAAGNLIHVYRNYIAKGKNKSEIRTAFEESARLMLKGHEQTLH